MGRPKANLPLEGGDTFLSRIVRTFSVAAAGDVVVVLGHDADVIASVFAGTGVTARFVTNPDYETGQLSSLLIGLNAVDRPGVTAARTPTSRYRASAATRPGSPSGRAEFRRM